MPAVTGHDADGGIYRDDLPLHELVGANTFVPKIIPFHPVFGSEVDPEILDEGVVKAESLLRRSATLDLTLEDDSFTVRVTNETGHKLPTGYPDGRRMWLHVRALDADYKVVLESGRYSTASATLAGAHAAPEDPDYDPYLYVWEARHHLDDHVAGVAGLPTGTEFHLVLSNVRGKDNRIPPRGFTNAAYEAFDGAPVGETYADGQYWLDVVYPVGPEAVRVEVSLYYQTTTRELRRVLA